MEWDQTRGGGGGRGGDGKLPPTIALAELPISSTKLPSAPVSHDQDCLLLYLLPFHSRPHRPLVTSYLPIFVPKYQFAIGTHHSSCLDLLSFHPCLSSPHISFVSSTELSCPSKPPSSPDPHQLNEFFSRLHPPKLPAFEQLDGQL